jgi:hypothetical protein
MNREKWKELARKAPLLAHKVCGKNLVWETEEEQLDAIKRVGGYILRSVYKPSPKVQLAAIKEDSYSIQYIDDPPEMVQVAAVKKDRHSIQFIKNPCREAIIIHLIDVAPELIGDPEFDLIWEEDDEH